jgi:hypothetical protein
MEYELYLRASESTPDLVTRVLDDLGESDAAPLAAGRWEVSGESGTVAVALHPAGDPRWEGGEGDPAKSLGVDLSIVGGAGEALATMLVELAFDWASRWSLDVYDPQLGRTVSPDEPDAITRRVKQHSEYLTDTVGLGEHSTRYMDVDVDVARGGLRAKFYFGLAAALLVLGLLAHYCS